MRRYIRRSAVFLCVIMAAIMPFTGCSNLLSTVLSSQSSREYDSITEKWANEYVNEKIAADDAYNTLMKAAEDGDKDTFISCFTGELRNSAGFSKSVDEFLANYPKGLYNAETDMRPAGAGGSVRGNKFINHAGASADITMDGKWYRVTIGFCYEYTDEPDKVGVETFTIRNLEAQAVYLKESNASQFYTEKTLACEIVSSDEVCARMIDGTPYLWQDTDTPKLTAGEMRTLLSEYRDLGVREVRDRLGEPNAEFESFSSTGCKCFYELKSEDGKPLYARISTKTRLGDIIEAYACSNEADSADYDNPLCAWIKPSPY